MSILLWIVAVLIATVALAYANASGFAWTATLVVALGAAWAGHLLPPWLTLALAVVVVLLALPLNAPTLRRKLISDALLAVFRRILPPMSQTEREAIEAKGGKVKVAISEDGWPI